MLCSLLGFAGIKTELSRLSLSLSTLPLYPRRKILHAGNGGTYLSLGWPCFQIDHNWHKIWLAVVVTLQRMHEVCTHKYLAFVVTLQRMYVCTAPANLCSREHCFPWPRRVSCRPRRGNPTCGGIYLLCTRSRSPRSPRQPKHQCTLPRAPVVRASVSCLKDAVDPERDKGGMCSVRASTSITLHVRLFGAQPALRHVLERGIQ